MNREALMINQTDRQTVSQPARAVADCPGTLTCLYPVLLQRARSASSREAAVASGRGVFLLGAAYALDVGRSSSSVSLGWNQLPPHTGSRSPSTVPLGHRACVYCK